MDLMGALMVVAGWLWLALLGFRESPAWGLGNLLVPLVGLWFAVTRFRECGAPLLLIGLGLVAMAMARMPV